MHIVARACVRVRACARVRACVLANLIRRDCSPKSLRSRPAHTTDPPAQLCMYDTHT